MRLADLGRVPAGGDEFLYQISASLNDLRTTAVVQRDGENGPGIRCGLTPGDFDLTPNDCLESFFSADRLESNVVFLEAREFLAKKLSQQSHQSFNFETR